MIGQVDEISLLHVPLVNSSAMGIIAGDIISATTSAFCIKIRNTFIMDWRLHCERIVCVAVASLPLFLIWWILVGLFDYTSNRVVWYMYFGIHQHK